jgi:hypothetical protein
MKTPSRWTILLAGAALLLFMSPAQSSGALAAVATDRPPVPAGEIRDIKGPLPPGRLFPVLVPGGVAVVLAGVVSLLIITRRRGRISDPLPETALLSPEAALDLLESRFSGKREDVGVLYQDLSNLVRTCLERRTGLPALRLTTDEILAEISGTGVSAPEPAQWLRVFLHRCDLVKFAGHEPPDTEIQECFSAARSIILSAGASSSHDLR